MGVASYEVCEEIQFLLAYCSSEANAGRRRTPARAVCAGVESCLSDDSRPTFFIAQHAPNCSDWEH